MANQPEVSEFTSGIYQLEPTDPVQGGEGGIDNLPLKQLANRTRWLYDRVSDLFVKQFYALTGATTLTTGDAGNAYVLFNASVYTVTLPAPNLFAQGKGFLFIHGGDANAPYKIFCPSANIRTGYGGFNTVSLKPLQQFWVLSTSTGWQVVGQDTWQDVGAIQAFSRTTAPLGWLACDGGLCSQSVFPDLYSIIGTMYGVGGGSTFRLPDLRGEFLRGWDNGRGIDTPSLVFTGVSIPFESGTTVGFTLTNLSSTAELFVGMSVSGSGVAPGAKIAAIVDSTTVQLDLRNTISTSNATVTFTVRQVGSWQKASGINGHVGSAPWANSQLAITVGDIDDTENYSITGKDTTNTGSSQSHRRYRVRPRNVAMLYCIKF